MKGAYACIAGLWIKFLYKEKHFYFQRHYITTNATLECGNGSFWIGIRHVTLIWSYKTNVNSC